MTLHADFSTTEQGEIHLNRKIELAFRGDWGQANFTRICGWLSQEVGDRVGAGSRFAIWNGRGGRDQADALVAGEADVAVMTPAAAVRTLCTGVGPFGGRPLTGLRALGVLGHRDRLVVAVDAALPVACVGELGSIADRLTIATSPDDGINPVGVVAHYMLRLAGVDAQALTAAGAQFAYDERPFPGLSSFGAGEVNVLITEALMTPGWQRIADRRLVRYLDWGSTVFDGLAELDWPVATVPAGYLPGLDQDLPTVDFSDFVILCREDLDDEIAYLVTWCMIRTRQALEAQYAHLPPERSPLVIPIQPSQMQNTPVPLHPAAERAYRDVGDSASADSAMWS
ncbi:hypothetical protein OQ968_02210 [Mycobacterium sp. 663a-19]|uniref:TAXI family TRAP transporter solute-binding subunit n=1 Tax=Mycobacterium sp. 663a-19 TaxID=2986148 RepID=UPI002D1F52E3|nr:TAXI family TRAP transporter solute-binding subunit [Mycobacterium sp. 663a-19]MEB3980071.1 hypothetical protein [Mycobacterium sp. 663a-19]